MAPEDAGNGHRIYHRTIEPDKNDANVHFVDLVAEIKGAHTGALPPLWDCIDDVLVTLFSDPPAQEAQVHIEFTYAGYRIDVDQSGDVELMKVASDPATER